MKTMVMQNLRGDEQKNIMVCYGIFWSGQFVRLFSDLVTIIEKRLVSLFDIIRKLYK